MIPDKIYTFQDDGDRYWYKPEEWETPPLTRVEYIRKDALLEWASRLKEKWEEPPMSRHSPGCVFMLEQLINKLNSM